MNREHSSLAAEPCQDTEPGSQKTSAGSVGTCLTKRFRKICIHKCTHLMLQQCKTHEQHQAADNCNEQIGVTGADRAFSLLMHDPGKGCQRQDLKESESRHKIPGEHHSLRCSQCHEDKQIVPVQILGLMPEILLRKQCGECPHQCRHQTVHASEAIRSEAQSRRKNMRDIQGTYRRTAARYSQRDKQHTQYKLQKAGHDSNRVSCFLAVFSNDIIRNSNPEGKEYN